MRKLLLKLSLLALFALPARAELPWDFVDNTKYLAMGDSLAAGYGAFPFTLGYAYQLYHTGAYDSLVNTTFGNAAVPDVTSEHVLKNQVPQALVFQPHVITISVGGNDLLSILKGQPPAVVLPRFQENLAQILCSLSTSLPGSHIYIHTLYDIPQITGGPGSDAFALLQGFNGIIVYVAGLCGAKVADVFGAFQGRSGLLLIERPGAHPQEPHPTTAGHAVMAAAFRAAR